MRIMPDRRLSKRVVEPRKRRCTGADLRLLRRIFGAGACLFVIVVLIRPHPGFGQDLLFSANQWGRINLTIEQSSSATNLESVLSNNPNFERLEPYPVDGRLRRLSRPVGRLDVRFPSGQFITCTASLIGAGRLITNHHCIPGSGQHGPVTDARLVMGYYSQSDSTVRTYKVNVRPIESSQNRDYSILDVEGRPGDEWGRVTLEERPPHPGEGLLIIHHPGGLVKHVTRGGCRAASPRPERDGVLLHLCDTLPGSSGAPIFSDDAGGMLALHFGGASAPGPGLYNEGVLVSALRDAGANFGQQPESSSPIVIEDPAYGWTSTDGLWRLENDTHFVTGIRGFNKSYFEPKTYSDLSFEAEFRKTSNNDGPLGLLIRYDPGRDKGYLLLVWPHGGYQFSILTGNDRQRLASTDPHPAVRKGGAWNTATITAVGPQFTLVINGNPVASFKDDAIDAGKVGLVIHGSSKNTAEFRSLKMTARGTGQ